MSDQFMQGTRSEMSFRAAETMRKRRKAEQRVIAAARAVSAMFLSQLPTMPVDANRAYVELAAALDDLDKLSKT